MQRNTAALNNRKAILSKAALYTPKYFLAFLMQKKSKQANDGLSLYLGVNG